MAPCTSPTRRTAACALSATMAASIRWRERASAPTRATAGQPPRRCSSARTMSSSISSATCTSPTYAPSPFVRSTARARLPTWRASASRDPWTSAASIRRAACSARSTTCYPGAVLRNDGAPPPGRLIVWHARHEVIYIADTFDHRVRRVTCGGSVPCAGPAAMTTRGLWTAAPALPAARAGAIQPRAARRCWSGSAARGGLMSKHQSTRGERRGDT
jgi:hypothetical protein